MAVMGLIGAVYESETAPVSENIALLFDWTLEVQHRKEYTYGPEIHGVPTGWHVKAESYWTSKNIPQGRYFVRLFIGKGKDLRCLTGQVELPTSQKTDGICESSIQLNGIGGVRCETKQ